MKKRACLASIGLLFVSVVMMGCAPVQKTTLTKSNLPNAKRNLAGVDDL